MKIRYGLLFFIVTFLVIMVNVDAACNNTPVTCPTTTTWTVNSDTLCKDMDLMLCSNITLNNGNLYLNNTNLILDNAYAGTTNRSQRIVINTGRRLEVSYSKVNHSGRDKYYAILTTGSNDNAGGLVIVNSSFTGFGGSATYGVKFELGNVYIDNSSFIECYKNGDTGFNTVRNWTIKNSNFFAPSRLLVGINDTNITGNNFTCTDAADCVVLDHSTGLNFSNNEVAGGNNILYLDTVNNSYFGNNYLHDTITMIDCLTVEKDGIHAQNDHHNIYYGNTIKNTCRGIFVYQSMNATINNNVIRNTSYDSGSGIALDQSNNSIVSYNYVYDGNGSAIDIVESFNDIASYNTLSCPNRNKPFLLCKNGYLITGVNISVNSSLISGYSIGIYSWFGDYVTHTKFLGYISNNIRIRNNTISLAIDGANWNIIEDWNFGIVARGVQAVSIDNNSVTSSSKYRTISLFVTNVSNQTYGVANITTNYLTGSNYSVWLNSTYTNLGNNLISNSIIGVYDDNYTNVTSSGNTIASSVTTPIKQLSNTYINSTNDIFNSYIIDVAGTSILQKWLSVSVYSSYTGYSDVYATLKNSTNTLYNGLANPPSFLTMEYDNIGGTGYNYTFDLNASADAGKTITSRTGIVIVEPVSSIPYLFDIGISPASSPLAGTKWLCFLNMTMLSIFLLIIFVSTLFVTKGESFEFMLILWLTIAVVLVFAFMNVGLNSCTHLGG